MPMHRYLYDGSFDGLLSALFAIYERGTLPLDIVRAEADTGHLLATPVRVTTSEAQAWRVLRGLTRTGTVALRDLQLAFLTQVSGVEQVLLRFAISQFGLPRDVDAKAAQPLLRQAAQAADQIERLAQQVRREVHRMHAFVRFEEDPSGGFVAEIEPLFPLLPLIADHFIARYPAQRWRIHDRTHHSALIYDGEKARIEATAHGPRRPRRPSPAEEHEMQRLWQTYFQATNIPARRNLPLQRRHVPLRYRRHLTEMRPLLDPQPPSG